VHQLWRLAGADADQLCGIQVVAILAQVAIAEFAVVLVAQKLGPGRRLGGESGDPLGVRTVEVDPELLGRAASGFVRLDRVAKVALQTPQQSIVDEALDDDAPRLVERSPDVFPIDLAVRIPAKAGQLRHLRTLRESTPSKGPTLAEIGK